MKKPDISFVIPAKNEERNIGLLYKQIVAETKKLGKSYEIVIVDDGSTDKTFSNAVVLHRKDENVKVIRHRGNWGKSAGLMSGFGHTTGEIIFTMDADLQDNPIDIPKFLKKLDSGYDLVTGWKKARKDSSIVVIPSRILNNFLIPMFTGVRIHDTNCGYKAYRREVVESLNLYGELYRFIPVMAAKQNFKVAEVVVHHRARKYGKSKYGIAKNYKGLLDLLTIVFLTGFVKRPGHFFGTLGLLSFFFGFLIGLYITYLRITTGTIQFRTPLLLLGIMLIVIGVQLFTTGLLAELIVSFSAKKKNESIIERKVI